MSRPLYKGHDFLTWATWHRSTCNPSFETIVLVSDALCLLKFYETNIVGRRRRVGERYSAEVVAQLALTASQGGKEVAHSIRIEGKDDAIVRGEAADRHVQLHALEVAREPHHVALLPLARILAPLFFVLDALVFAFDRP